ncbi:unnamed protein product [Spirodela intermedia]|uniref:Uncharacterized protein n=1 Tax=Spirodela intermedia TaxID=51605 RepID=A0A7I8JA73_SPIIN|nr:unnamed protein product [Spirodela intermedia]CAA6667047.1 unnamed protein product [Spirodela intermedia]
MPVSDYSFLKMPRSLEDLQVLRDHLESYASDYTLQVLVGYCAVYIFMQTFMIPGTIFMPSSPELSSGPSGVALVVFAATAGASSCFSWKLLNYMLFLRVTPTLPNTFINMASPIVDVPYHTFFLATFIGLIPAAFVTVRAGIALGDLKSVNDLYDFQSVATLFLIGAISVTPTILSKARTRTRTRPRGING